VTYIEFTDPEMARSALDAAIEFLMFENGYTAAQITEHCQTKIDECERELAE
jgi:hypothetical protein